MPAQKFSPPFSAYLPIDRRHALATGHTLPDHVEGAALLADIVGFTPLADILVASLGPQRGAEELTGLLNTVYDALIAQVHQYGGSVVSFVGDGLMCWFDGDTGLRATACGLEMQQSMIPIATTSPMESAQISLSIKCGVSTGSARRFLVGQPHIDLLAGATLDRVAQAEQVAQQGEVVAAPEIVQTLGDRLNLGDERDGFVTVANLTDEITPTPWPELKTGALNVERLRPYLLPPVYKRLADDQGEFLAELRPAAALFLRFEGLDYERDDAGSQLDAFVRRVQEILARYEGHLLQLTAGDKGSFLYAAFGALTAHEDDAARAVEAAMALRQIPAELDAISGVQIGLSRGRVRAGAYGSRTRRTYGAIGPEAIVACRLMEVALPDQVWCSPAIHEAAGGQWEFESLAPVALKGKAEPLPVYRPVRQTSGRAVRAAGTLIGRQAELETLTRLLADAQSGRRRVLLLEGEAGIGKSRLLAELRQLAQQQGVPWLEGAGQSIEQGTPYRAWRDVLMAYLDLDQQQSQADRRRQMQERVTGVNPALVERVPLLNDVLRLDLPETDLTQSFDPKLRHESLTALIVDLLRAGAAEGPFALVLEDAHWMDSLSWEMALSVARALPSPPSVPPVGGGERGGLLLVIALRPLEEPVPAEPVLSKAEGYTALTKMEDAETLHLDALPLEETVALAATRLGVQREALPEEIAALIQERAGGNPFFAEELAHVLRDSSAIRVEDGACTLTGDLEALRERVPDTIEGVVLARIDRLPPEQQLTLKVAAVIGRGFLYRTLHDVHPRQVVTDLLQAQLDGLEQRELTLVEALEPELSYLFKHVITQQVAYDTLLFSRRRELHRAVAGWYERVYAENLSPYYPLLVHHWGRAEDVAQERHYARLAGEQAAAQYANAEALRYLGRALELAPESDLAERYALLLAREKVYHRLAQREPQKQDLEALETLADALDDNKRRGEIALRRAGCAEVLTDYAHAIAAAQKVIRLAQNTQDVSLEIEGHLKWGLALWRQGDSEGRRHTEQALELARAASLRRLEAKALSDLCTFAGTQGELEKSLELSQQALSICREIGYREGEATLLANTSYVFFIRGDYATFETYCERAISIFREMGDRRRESLILTNLCLALRNTGSLGKARVGLDRALQIGREISDPYLKSCALDNLGILFWLRGDLVRARDYHEQALTLLRQIGKRRDECISLSNLGIVLKGLGDYTGALDFCEQCLRLCREIGYQPHEGYALDALGNLHQTLGNYDKAKTQLEQALSIFSQNGDHQGEAQSLCNLSLLYCHLGDGAKAQAQGQRSLDIALEINEPSRQADALTNLGHAHMLLGTLDQASDAYRQALTLRRDVGQNHLALEAKAGLARIALQESDLSQSQAYVNEILIYLETNTTDGTEDPFQTYLTCYQVLAANDDPRAREVLSTAYDLLQERAAHIDDETLSRSFLENVAVHREILQAWEGAG